MSKSQGPLAAYQRRRWARSAKRSEAAIAIPAISGSWGHQLLRSDLRGSPRSGKIEAVAHDPGEHGIGARNKYRLRARQRRMLRHRL